MESKTHKNKDSPQNCVDSDAVKPEKIKFPLYLHPDTMEQVETLYKADNCTSKTEFLEKAVRFYCGYLQSENAADFLAPELVSMLDGIVKGSEQRLSRGLFKVAVELGAVTHMLAAILSICRILNDQQINRQSKSGIWRKETVRYILSNEAYIGDSLWRKKYTANQFPFQKRENHGEIPQYYCKNHHPAIVNEATFEAAQKLIAEKSYDREKPEKYPLTCKIECADCGTKWMRCVRRGKVYWVCRKHKERAADCAMKPVPEQAFFDAFLRFFHKLKQNYNHIFPPLFSQLQALKDRRYAGNQQYLQFSQEIIKCKEQIHVLTRLRSKGFLDEKKFLEQTTMLQSKISRQQKKLCDITKSEDDDRQLEALRETASAIENAPDLLVNFDAGLFETIIEKITVTDQKTLKFHLHGGLTFTEEIV